MASVIANGPGTPMVTRGKGTNIGTLPTNASTTAVQFTISQLANNPNGFDTIVIICTGGTVTAASGILEVSIDGGNTWAQVLLPTNASSIETFSLTTFGGDTAASFAAAWTVAGLSGLALFRFGAAVTAGSAVVWVAVA